MMLGITMTKTGGRKAFAIIINDHRAEAYLITSVPVDIGNGIIVIALSVIG